MDLSPAAQRVQAALVARGAQATVVELPASTRTAQEAATTIGCEVAQIAKSLVFRRLADGAPILVIASGGHRVDEALLATAVGGPIERADADFVRATTGFAIGGVPPLGHERPLEVLVDAALLAFDRVWAAAGTPRAVFAITPAELLRTAGGRVVTLAAGARACIDHVILAARDLDTATAEIERRTGVQPVYGGKHPTGTHNALVALGPHSYLEIIAAQPGASPPARFASLLRAAELEPIAWAVAGADAPTLRQSLEHAGIATAAPESGSRVTPAGATLRWQLFDVAHETAGAPFFIVWDAVTAHPATTSPAGCELQRLLVATPDDVLLVRLRDALGLAVEIAPATRPAMTVTLRCPRGEVTFGP